MNEYAQKIAAQREFYNTGATLSLEFRLTQLHKLRELLLNEKSKICQAIYKDLRRRPELTEFYELGLNFQELERYIAHLGEWMRPEHPPKSLFFACDATYIQREPFGVVLLISPFNYPVNLTITPLIPVLAAGNTCIIKPSELSPHTAAMFQELINKYFDPRVCDVVQTDGPGTARLLENRFDYICYTGSTRIAKVVMEAASKHLTPTLLELGGQSPVLLDDTVDLEVSARRLLWGKTSNAGQTCLAPNHLFVTESVKQKVVPVLDKVLREFYGNDAQKSADFMRYTNHRHFDRVAEVLAQTRGRVLTQLGQLDRDDLFVPPMLVEVEAGDVLLREELFAPVLPIRTVGSLDEAIELVRAGEKPLGAYLFSNDPKLQDKFLTRVECGNIGINDVMLNFAVDNLPFGGVGNSGMGRYRGKYGFDTFSNLKSVVHRSFWLEWLMAIRYPPLTAHKLRLMGGAASRMDVPTWIGPACCKLSWLLAGLGLGVLLQRYRRNEIDFAALKMLKP